MRPFHEFIRQTLEGILKMETEPSVGWIGEAITQVDETLELTEQSTTGKQMIVEFRERLETSVKEMSLVRTYLIALLDVPFPKS